MAWRRKPDLEQKFDEELETHLAMLTELFMKKGMSPAEAGDAARRQFGNIVMLKEVRREMSAFMPLEILWQDVRFGARAMKRSARFTVAAVLLLTLGIGANTAIFSVLDELLLRPLRVSQPHELALLRLIPSTQKVRFPAGFVSPREFLGADPGFPYALYGTLRSSNNVFADVLADFKLLSLDLTDHGGSGATWEARVNVVSGNYFSTLGVTPRAGRLLIDADSGVVGSGGPHGPVAVLSYRFWQRRFGLDPTVIGRIVQLNGRPFTIIGVAEPGFDGEYVGMPSDVWVPIALLPSLAKGLQLEDAGFTLIGRLKPGISRAQAQAGLQSFFRQNPGASAFYQFTLSVFEIEVKDGSQGVSSLRESFSAVLVVVMSAVGLVLLIACANLATLLLARAAARRREVSIRLALGAGRGRVVRQLLTESLLLAALGGLGGLVLARWGATVLIAVMSGGNTDALAGVGLDWRILAFATAVTVLSGILFGLAPALLGTRLDLNSALKSSPRDVRARAHSGVTGMRGLIASQVALSAVLLMGASLFVRTLQNLETLDVGFSREHTVLMTFDLGESGYRGAKLAALSDDFERRIRTLPGVVATTTASGTPFGASLGGSPVQVPGYIPRADDSHFCPVNQVGADFFRASGIPLLSGREFGPQDGEAFAVTASETNDSVQPAVVSETFARKYFAGQDAVGRRFTIRRGTPIEVIGVAKDAKYKNLRERTEPLIYLSNARDRSSWRRLNLIVRFTGAPRYAASLMTAIRAEVSRANGGVRIAAIETMQNLIDRSLIKEHMVTDLSGAAGGLALLIVCIGLYGAVSYAVARRTQEIGIRAALGASERDILWMVLRENLATVFAGVVFGLPAALVVARLLAGRLFGVTAADPFSIAATILLITAVAAAAGVVPAWRGSRIDPMAALRYE